MLRKNSHTIRSLLCFSAIWCVLYTSPVKAESTDKKELLPSQLAQRHPDWLYLHGDRAIKEVALTFDDGPDLKATPSLLNILKEQNVHATFFVTGKHALKYPEMVKRIQKEGHEIGNHSFDHANFKKLPLSSTQGEVQTTDSILTQLLGRKPSLFRAPYGNINEIQLQKIVQQNGYKVIGWDVDSIDWKAKDPASVVQNVLTHVHPGSIILEHTIGSDGPEKNPTVQSLTSIITSLRKQGYTFVTVSQMLQLDPFQD